MVRVVVAGEKDIREMLAKEAVALGNAMLSCEEEKKTLEELFFQLINQINECNKREEDLKL